MGWRGLGMTAVLTVVGALVGGGLARVVQEEPVTLDTSRPVAASSPSFPTDPPVQVLPDPNTPPLAGDLETHVGVVGQDPFALRLPVPNGWTRSNPRSDEAKWLVESQPQNTYFLRAFLPSGYRTITRSRDDRIEELDGATGLQEFTVETTTANGFTATYVLDGYRRVTMELFLSLDGTPTLDAVVALVGREVDRPGMSALMDRIAAEATR